MSERYIPTAEEKAQAFRTLAHVGGGHGDRPFRDDLEDALKVCIWALAECYRESGADPDSNED